MEHMHQDHPSNEIADAILAGSLISAPAWSPPLAAINDLLLTISLLLGIAIALVRLWFIFTGRK